MDAPIRLSDPALQVRLSRAIDAEGKVARAVAELASVPGRRVVLVGASPRGRLARALRQAGAAQVTTRPSLERPSGGMGRRRGPRIARPFDVLVASYCGFDEAGGPGLADALLTLAQAELVPEGRVVAVQAYGRDDVSRLLADPVRERRQVGWNHRRGPLLTSGWRVRTLHCWWRFGSLDAARRFLVRAFPGPGAVVAAELRRPRLSYKVGVFHRSLAGAEAATEPAHPASDLPSDPASDPAIEATQLMTA